ncbi:MAG: hypothetical protein PHU88_01255 [candidate division Zixibacteria bacterium]|nr:hypothetical protein [candidate division Zixibacteria bacterium]MDD5427032.1 hypothetical protein [candidate division Zixibacteria bacterium]
MYKIEKSDFGYKLTFGGKMDLEEMSTWFNESKEILKTASRGFGVFVDMRELQLLEPDAQKEMQAGQRYYRHMGMKRSIVILDNPILTVQFKRIALQSGIYDNERYIDASTVSNWEEIGMDWIMKGIDPDKNPKNKAMTVKTN